MDPSGCLSQDKPILLLEGVECMILRRGFQM